MNLTKQDLQELIERANGATPGPYFTIEAPWAHADGAGLTVIAGNIDPHKAQLVAEFGLSVDWTDDEDDPRIQENRNARYFCAANPSTVKQLAEAVLGLSEALKNCADLMSGSPSVAPMTDDVVLAVAREALDRWGVK